MASPYQTPNMFYFHWDKRHFDRDSLRERERQARAQMSSKGSELQEVVPMFGPPVKVNLAASDPEAKQIQRRLGDYHAVKHLLDDSKSYIGVCGEPPSPSPGAGPIRGGEFKKPNHTSSQNGRLHQRVPYYAKPLEGMAVGAHNRAPPSRFQNGKSDSNPSIDPVNTATIENIFKEMKSLPKTPLSAITATPRKEVESKFTFNAGSLVKSIESVSQSNNTFCEPKQSVPSKTHLDRRNSRLSVELERDLRLTDSEDEPRKPIHSPTVASPAGGSSSDSGSSDSDSDSSSDDSKPNGGRLPVASPVPDIEETPEVVEGPGETSAVPPHHRSSWSLRNFAPPRINAPAVQSSSPRSNNSHSSPIRNNKHSPRSTRPSPNWNTKSSPKISNRLSPRTNRSSPRCAKSPRSNKIGDTKINNISSTAPGSNTSTSSNASGIHNESDSCSDSTKEVENVLAEAKGKAEKFLSDLSNSDGSDNDVRRSEHSDMLGSNFDKTIGTNRSGSRIGSRRSPRTPARPRPPSSPSGSEDEVRRPPRPDPEKRKGRGRPRKLRTEEDAVKRKRGRPRKSKLTPVPIRPPPSTSDDENSHSSPPIVPHWSESEEECSNVATDKKKNDTLRKLFIPSGGAKGGGKGGAKGGKGKGQVMIIEAYTLEHDKEDDVIHRRFKEDENFRTKEEDQRRLKDEEISHRKMKEEEAALLKKMKEEESRKREEETLKRIREDETVRRKRDEEITQIRLKEAVQKRQKEEEALQRKKLLEEEKKREEENKKRLEEEMKRREAELEEKRKEELLRRLHDEEVQKRLKNEKMLSRKLRDEEFSRRRKMRENEVSPRIKDEDPLHRRIREDEANQRRLKVEDIPEVVTGVPDPSQMMVRIDLWKLSAEVRDKLTKSAHSRKRPPPPPAPPDKRLKMTRQIPEATLVKPERVGIGDLPRNCLTQPLVYYSYLEKGYQESSSDEESRDHNYYLSEAARIRALAEKETDQLSRIMLYLESVLCLVLTGRVLELELDTKKAFTMYRETLEYIKSISSVPAHCRASPYSDTFTKLDILSYRCQALLYLRMFKMYKREVKEFNKVLQEYHSKPPCVETVGTVSPLSPTPSPAGSIGSVGSAGSTSSGYGSAAMAATPPTMVAVTLPVSVHNAAFYLVKYYTFLNMGHDLWDQADNLIREHNWIDLFVSIDKVCGPLTMHSSFHHLVKYIRYALERLKQDVSKQST